MILLVGDYSSVHYELAAELKQGGERVILISDGDGYKRVHCDIKLPTIMTSKYIVLDNMLAIIRFFGVFGVINYITTKREIERLGDIDVAQIINPVVIPSLGALGNLLLIRFLRKKVRVLSLCALGDDYSWVDSCLKRKCKYSPLDRLFSGGVVQAIKYFGLLKYVYSPLYRLLDFYARDKVDMIIPGLLDYKIAYQANPKAVDIIKVPIARHNFTKPESARYPLKIFHAWQKGKESKKGNDVLDRVVKRYIKEHGAQKVDYEIISGLAYDDYLKKYKESDIILDQIYSYDCGVTAALAMAAGKVVFSGFELGHLYTGVNATPDENKLYDDFCVIVNSLDLVWAIKKNAYCYAVENYSANLVAEKYLKIWDR